nr:DELLA protein GAI1-like [Ipomoea batatas]
MKRGNFNRSVQGSFSGGGGSGGSGSSSGLPKGKKVWEESEQDAGMDELLAVHYNPSDLSSWVDSMQDDLSNSGSDGYPWTHSLCITRWDNRNCSLLDARVQIPEREKTKVLQREEVSGSRTRSLPKERPRKNRPGRTKVSGRQNPATALVINRRSSNFPTGDRKTAPSRALAEILWTEIYMIYSRQKAKSISPDTKMQVELN